MLQAVLLQSGAATPIHRSGAVAAGGIISLIKSLPLIVRTFADAIKGMKGAGNSNSAVRTEVDLDMRVIGIGVLIMIIAIWLLPGNSRYLRSEQLLLHYSVSSLQRFHPEWLVSSEAVTIRYPVWQLQLCYFLHSA